VVEHLFVVLGVVLIVAISRSIGPEDDTGSFVALEPVDVGHVKGDVGLTHVQFVAGHVWEQVVGCGVGFVVRVLTHNFAVGILYDLIVVLIQLLITTLGIIPP